MHSVPNIWKLAFWGFLFGELHGAKLKRQHIKTQNIVNLLNESTALIVSYEPSLIKYIALVAIFIIIGSIEKII